MYIYNGKVLDFNPKKINTKKFKVTLEDVMLSFISSDIIGSNIIVSYSISYFNIPQNINEYEIERRLDFNSLTNVIKDTLGYIGDFVTVYKLSAKFVQFKFDVQDFLKHATFPMRLRKVSVNQFELRLNRKIPEFIDHTSSGILVQIMSSIMTSMLRKNNKYKSAFKLKGKILSRNAILSAQYDQNRNVFMLETKNPYDLYYYYLKK